MRVSPAVVRRFRRFGLSIALGYALHFPAGNVAALAGLPPDRWRSFFAVDALQPIGAMFIVIQALVMASRSRRVFMVMSFALAVPTIALTPIVWRYP